jgi:TonB family protein
MNRSWLVLPLLVAVAAGGDERFVKGPSETYEVMCAGDTVSFEVRAWLPAGADWVPTADDSAGRLLRVSDLRAQSDGGGKSLVVPFEGKTRSDEGLILRWGDEAGTFVITVPWIDVSAGKVGQPIACAREETPPLEISPAPPEQAFHSYDEPPRPIKIFTPEYPTEARQGKIAGVVHVRMTIGESGRVTEASVYRSDTVAALEAAAVHAAKLSIFRPAMVDGVPVRSRIVFPFRFKS